MDRTERFYRIDQLLNDKKIVPFSLLVEKLEVSRATIKRDLEYMRNRLYAFFLALAMMHLQLRVSPRGSIYTQM